MSLNMNGSENFAPIAFSQRYDVSLLTVIMLNILGYFCFHFGKIRFPNETNSFLWLLYRSSLATHHIMCPYPANGVLLTPNKINGLPQVYTM